MSLTRRCSKTTCTRVALATLTYNYGEQTAVLGPLATFAEPHTYDLCATHAGRLTVPQGWDVVRLVGPLEERDEDDDLLALADASGARRPARGSEARRPLAPDVLAAAPSGAATETAGPPSVAVGGDGKPPRRAGRPELRVLRGE